MMMNEIERNVEIEESLVRLSSAIDNLERRMTKANGEMHQEKAATLTDPQPRLVGICL